MPAPAVERFRPELLARRAPRGIDAVTTLRHFAIVTWACDPGALRAHLHPRFEPDLVRDAAGEPRALVSAVPFLDVDFRLAACPWPRLSFGQTNYRAYVVDRESGERTVWFFGTVLDSLSVLVPRHAWKLPWHRGRVRFDCERAGGRYTRWRMSSESEWAPAELELTDSGAEVTELAGFADLEHALVVLTHPLRGWFTRRDGRLGTYEIWHDRLAPTVGSCVRARFDLLDRLGLVPLAEQARPHSVLLQHETEFTIYLPPRAAE